MGQRPPRLEARATLQAARRQALGHTARTSAVPIRRALSPESDDEPLSEDEPELMPMADLNLSSSPTSEHPARATPTIAATTDIRTNGRGSTFHSSAAAAVRPPNAPPSLRAQLGPLMRFLAETQPTVSWHSRDALKDPLHAFVRDPRMNIIVMDHLVHYLQQHSNLAGGRSHNVAAISPTVYQLALYAAGRSGNHSTISEAAWQHSALPTYLVVPVVQDGHWYVWRGAVWKKGNSHWECELRYLSSVGRPHQGVLNERVSNVKKALRVMFPQLRKIHTRHHHIPGYRQARGSSDCGLFAAQTVSACLFEQPGALYELLSVNEVKQRTRRILEACAGGVLQRISEGYVPEYVCLLHNHRVAPSGNPEVESLPSRGHNVVYLLPDLYPIVREEQPGAQQAPGSTPCERLTWRHSNAEQSLRQEGGRSSQLLQSNIRSQSPVSWQSGPASARRELPLKLSISIMWE